MSEYWALLLEGDERPLAARLRQHAQVEVAMEEPKLWLRGPKRDEALQRDLRLMPGGRLFDVLPDGQLRRPGTLVPDGHLPATAWLPILNWISVSLPARTTFLAQASDKLELRLVRDVQEREPNLLVTSLDLWVSYAVTAPQVRLQRWQFAASEDRRVVVRGQPLPPLSGERFVECEGVAIPAGWQWSPNVESGVIQELLCLTAGDVALLHVNGDYEMVAGANFVQATRSAVRHTAEVLARD